MALVSPALLPPGCRSGGAGPRAGGDAGGGHMRVRAVRTLPVRCSWQGLGRRLRRAAGGSGVGWRPACRFWLAQACPGKSHQMPIKARLLRPLLRSSDVHYWKRGRIASFVVREPMVIGHESAGTVAAVGPGVTGLQVGRNRPGQPGPVQPCTCRAVSRLQLLSGQFGRAAVEVNACLLAQLVQWGVPLGTLRCACR